VLPTSQTLGIGIGPRKRTSSLNIDQTEAQDKQIEHICPVNMGFGFELSERDSRQQHQTDAVKISPLGNNKVDTSVFVYSPIRNHLEIAPQSIRLSAPLPKEIRTDISQLVGWFCNQHHVHGQRLLRLSGSPDPYHATLSKKKPPVELSSTNTSCERHTQRRYLSMPQKRQPRRWRIRAPINRNRRKRGRLFL
jgi:hypothetical protein